MQTYILCVLLQYFPGAPFESLYTAVWQPGVEQVPKGVGFSAPGTVLPRRGVCPFPLGGLPLEFPFPF